MSIKHLKLQWLLNIFRMEISVRNIFLFQTFICRLGRNFGSFEKNSIENYVQSNIRLFGQIVKKKRRKNGKQQLKTIFMFVAE